MPQTAPLPRTMLLIDTERFSDRDDVQQALLRRMLFSLVDRVLLTAGVDQTMRLRADRGDAVMELIDPAVPLTTLLRALLTDLPAELRAMNRMAASSTQLRLRAVLAGGYVAVDEYDGWVGTDLNDACRLLDADPLRAALRERAGDFVLCVSESVHAGIVRHQHTGIPAEEFTHITVPTKNGPLPAWLHGPLPTLANPSATPPPADPTPASPTPAPSPAPSPAGIDFRGTNHGVVANRVEGGISFGDSGGRR
ncbi:hypothetical protein OHU17_15075 [Streptomyces goshikiensis]|uniref:Guanylate cyclase domain-containing protein n=1 Tax=Streptomyces goshikiensis TaxID=1942 RepID=A0ABZ1RJS7_9ACTN|nr:hypothetical protein [Streptomyces goshikiensis]